MILIDTNVISELMRREPAPVVLEWFARQDSRALHISAVVEAELRRGVSILPMGQRRTRLMDEINAMIVEDFAGRVLPFDSAAAAPFAAIFADRRSAGRPISYPDCQIAAITRMHNARLATRNVDDFEDCGIEIVNPWE
ncbi:MAG: type II toxin-antitoxin system VapC family toxin [Pseudomonadota bacterium]